MLRVDSPVFRKIFADGLQDDLRRSEDDFRPLNYIFVPQTTLLVRKSDMLRELQAAMSLKRI